MAKRPVSKERARAALDELTKDAGAQWRQLRNPKESQTLRLYYRHPNRRQWIGRLKVAATDPHRGWKLANGVCFDPSWSQKQAEAFIYESMIRVPILRPNIR